jgi:hypothetical protein
VAYTADINIVVRGQAAVNTLQTKLTELGQKIDDIAKKRIGPTTTLDTFNAQLAEAARRLNQVAAGTDLEKTAIDNYVTALGNANAATDRQNKLIQEQIDLRQASTQGVQELAAVQQHLYNKQVQLENSELDAKAAAVQAALDKQAAAAAESAAQIELLNRRQADFIDRTNEAAQAASRQTAEFYRQQRIAREVAKLNAAAPPPQLLLAPAAPGAPAMSGGARSLITGPVERLGGARTQDQADTALRFAQALKEQVRPLSQFVPLYAGIFQQAEKLSRVKALPDSAMLNAAGRGLQTIEGIERRRLERLERIRQKLQQIAEYEASKGRMGNAGFGPQGPAMPPGGIPKKGGGGLGFNPNPSGENMALGLGFPLLFGGGAGQVAGGLIGSFFGEGFGGQILGSAIGQILEDAQRRITEIGNALDMLDMDKLRESVVFVNAELDTTVRRLIEAGDAQKAQAIAADAVATQTGMIPQAVADISGNANVLVNIWNQFLGAVSGTLSIIGVPFVSALSLILSGFTKILQYTNLLVTTVGAWGASLARQVMNKFPWIARYYNRLLNGTKAITEEEEKRNAVLQAAIDKQVNQNYNTAKNLALEKQRTLGRTAAEKLINIELDRGLEINRINAEYEEKILQFRRDNAGATAAQVEKGVRQIQVAQALAIEQVRIKTLLQEQGLAMDAINERYDRAAEAIRRQQTALETSNNVRQSQLSAESALNDLYGAQLERQYQLATTSTQRYNIAIAQFQQQVRAAQIEYVQSKLNNQLLIQRAAIEAKLAELQYRKYVAQKQLTILEAARNGATSKQIDAIASGYDVLLGTQIDVVQFAYDQVEAAKQIAANQDTIAAAVYKTKIVQLEGALAQKLTTTEIGLSQKNADSLAGSLAVAAFQAIDVKNQSSQLAGVIQVGTQKTRILASAMSDVAYNANIAANNIERAFRTGGLAGSNKQPAAKTLRGSITVGNKTTKLYAADGAFWPGGFKAFAKGGVVNRPTLGLIGEGGESEYIVPESKAAGFATSYLFGKRGEDAIPSEGSGAGAPPLTINVTTGPVMEFDGQRYVTVTDMERAMRLTAEGVIGRLRTPSARIALGIA